MSHKVINEKAKRWGVTARYVHPSVEDVIENPTQDASAELALKLDEGRVSTVRQRVREFDGEFVDRLTPVVVVVKLDEPDIEGFCSPEWIQSIAFPDEMRILT